MVASEQVLYRRDRWDFGVGFRSSDFRKTMGSLSPRSSVRLRPLPPVLA